MNPKNDTKISTNNEISGKVTRAQNLDDCQIIITETKLENILMKFKAAITSGSDWKTPLSLDITTIIIFLTADFNKNFLSIQSDVWQALFILTLIFSTIWLCWSICKKFINRNMTIEKLIIKIKNEES